VRVFPDTFPFLFACARTHLLAAALRRMGGYHCTMRCRTTRRTPWCLRCWRLIRRASRRRTATAGCRSIMQRDIWRLRRWFGRCWWLTRAPPRKRTGCARHARTTLCAALHRLRAYLLSLARLHAAQDGLRPLHFAAAGKASVAVVKALLAEHPGAAKEKDGVRPPRPHNVPSELRCTACAHTCSHSLAAALCRVGKQLRQATVGGCRCTLLREGRRQRRWWRRCWRLTLALPEAHLGAARKKDEVRTPRPHNRLYMHTRSHLLAAALRRVETSRCTLLRQGERRRRWLKGCWRLTLTLPRRRKKCTHTVPAHPSELGCAPCVHACSHLLSTALRRFLGCCRCILL